MDKKAILRVVQISDIHLFADKEKRLLGVNTQESFQAVIRLLQQASNQTDFIVLSGDLSQDGSMAAYTYIADVLRLFHIPIYWIAGNHDDFKIMEKAYPRDLISNQKHIILKTWQIILLNSQKPGAVEGYFDSSQLHFLQKCLQSYPDHYAAVFFHHHPVSVGCGWLERIGLTNANEFWKLITLYPNVKGVFFGHVHQEFEQIMEGISCYSAPSTCFQFKPQQIDFALEKNPPGYRSIEFHDNGCFETAVQRVKEYVGEFDVHAKGY